MNALRTQRVVSAAVVLAALLASSGCSSASPVPSAAEPSAFQPVAQTQAQKAVIEIPTYDSETVYGDMLKRLNKSLDRAGLNVEFLIRGNGVQSLRETVRTESASGNFSASAYALSRPDSAALLNDKITMDVTDLVKQNAPVYCSKYKDLLPETMGGVPVAIYSRPLLLKPALMLEQDFEQVGSSVSTVEGFFRFIEEAIIPAKEKKVVMAEPYFLINEWELEQGYYNLDYFNLPGFLYAAVEDAKCVPVPMESIPGFEGFLKKLCSYYTCGALSAPGTPVGKAEVAGYITPLHIYFTPSPHSLTNWMLWVKGSFKAHVFSPDLSSHMSAPFYNVELAVPAAGSVEKAVDVARFVEWLYSDQGNYDTVMYGEKGVDFRDENGRFSPLAGGQSMELTQSDQPGKYFFTWPGSYIFSNSDYCRVPALAPAGVEEIVDDAIRKKLRFPLADYLDLYDSSHAGILDIPPELKSICDQRQKLMDNFLYSSPNALAMRTDENVATLVQGLSACKNDQIIGGCANVIKGVIAATESGDDSP